MFLQAGDLAAPGAEPNSGSLLPGGRVDLKGTERLIDNKFSLPELARFLKPDRVFCAPITALFTVV